MLKNLKQNSLYIHSSQTSSDSTGAVSVPIYHSSTFKQPAPGEHSGYEYARSGSPTRAALEDSIAKLESGQRGLAFSSGLAALSTVMMLFSSGDHLIVSEDVYGGSYRVLTKVFQRFGMDFDFVDTSDMTAIQTALRQNTKALLIETPTNPLLKISDIRAIAEWAKSNSLITIVDNTFMTPYWQKPLQLGADIVIHSATKYIGGHSDVIAGLAVTASAEWGNKLQFLQNAVGAVLGPQDSWLLMRGLKTLPVRMQQTEGNALQLALFLEGLPQVKKVFYPGLPNHQGHLLHKQQSKGFGGVISFELDNETLADKLLRNIHMITLAESLGAVESLISLPAKMTHASIPQDIRTAKGISNSLVRLSVGIEDVNDIKNDILNALR